MLVLRSYFERFEAAFLATLVKNKKGAPINDNLSRFGFFLLDNEEKKKYVPTSEV